MTNITNSTFEGLVNGATSVTVPALPSTMASGSTRFTLRVRTRCRRARRFPDLPTWTQIGFTVGVATAPAGALPNALVITNGTPTTTASVGDGSMVTLTDGGNASASPVVYGSVQITNNNAQPLQSNQVNLVGTTVYGKVFVDNVGGGDTRTSVQQSFLGEQLQDNGPVEVVNAGVGQNQYLMTGSELPWGLAVAQSPGVVRQFDDHRLEQRRPDGQRRIRKLACRSLTSRRAVRPSFPIPCPAMCCM